MKNRIVVVVEGGVVQKVISNLSPNDDGTEVMVIDYDFIDDSDEPPEWFNAEYMLDTDIDKLAEEVGA
mgnify:CR=1 FL=1